MTSSKKIYLDTRGLVQDLVPNDPEVEDALTLDHVAGFLNEQAKKLEDTNFNGPYTATFHLKNKKTIDDFIQYTAGPVDFTDQEVAACLRDAKQVAEDSAKDNVYNFKAFHEGCEPVDKADKILDDNFNLYDEGGSSSQHPDARSRSNAMVTKTRELGSNSPVDFSPKEKIILDIPSVEADDDINFEEIRNRRSCKSMCPQPETVKTALGVEQMAEQLLISLAAFGLSGYLGYESRWIESGVSLAVGLISAKQAMFTGMIAFWKQEPAKNPNREGEQQLLVDEDSHKKGYGSTF